MMTNDIKITKGWKPELAISIWQMTVVKLLENRLENALGSTHSQLAI